MVAPATTGYLQTLPTKPAAAPASTTYAPSQLDVIAHVETGDTQHYRNAIHESATRIGRRDPAQGNFQFITPTGTARAD